MRLPDIDTPAVLVDLDRAEANMRRTQAYADRHGLKLRPHVKTHRLPRFALRQVELGAVGVTCQTLGEAEVMADAGIRDIFLPYNIIGEAKLARLLALAERVELSVTTDSPAGVVGLSSVFAGRADSLNVLVECDTGHGGCGVQDAEEAVDLATMIDLSPGLRFGGLMTYPAHGKVEATTEWLRSAVERLGDAGMPAGIVSNGGTPDLWRAHEVETATEHRPGTYIYMDRYQVERLVGTWDDCALSVLTTVVSRPTPDRAIIDAGSKALTTDRMGLEGYGRLVDYPDAVIRTLGEAYGVVDLSLCPERPAIGERLRIIPNHACVVTNLFETVTLISGDRLVETVPVGRRGEIA